MTCEKTVRKSFFVLVGWLGLSAASIRAGEDLPHIIVPKVEKPPVLDGKGSDPVWNTAAKVKLSDFVDKKGEEPQPTRVSLLYDARFLYVAFDCQDSDIRAIRTEHDDQTFRDDSVEIYLAAPEERLSDSVGIEINALGTAADFYYRHADWINYRWEPKLVIKVSRNIDKGSAGYRVEVAVPFHDILPAIQLADFPHQIRANFSRWDRGVKDRFTIWSDPKFSFSHPHRPERYGWLELQ